jgi:hypothetical protein
MSDGEKTRHEIEKALQALARNEGVERHNLKELLEGPLHILTEAWSLDLTKDLPDVQAAIYDRISAHMAAMSARKSNSELKEEWRREQFRRVVVVLFNVHPRGSKNPHSTALIKKRYEYLAGPSNTFKGVGIAITDDTARRDFDHARAEIAEVLARRLEAIAVVNGPLQDAGERASDLGQPPPADSDIAAGSSGDAEIQTRPKANRRFNRRAVLLGTTVIALVAGSLVAFRMVGTAGTSAPSTAATDPPIKVVAQYLPGGSFSWIVPYALNASDTSSVNRTVSTINWVETMHAVPSGEGDYELNITGNDPDGVIIDNIGVDFIAKRSTFNGTFMCASGQGMNPNQDIMFDLDSDPPVALSANLHDSNYGKPFFANQNLSLVKNESITFDVTADAANYDYIFDLVFTIDVQNKLVTYKALGLGGQPFQVDGVPTAPYEGAFVPTHNLQSLKFETGQQFDAAGSYACSG